MNLKGNLNLTVEQFIDFMAWSFMEGYTTGLHILVETKDTLSTTLKDDLIKAFEPILKEKGINISSIVSPYEK